MSIFLDIIESRDTEAIKSALSKRFADNFKFFEQNFSHLLPFMHKKAVNYAITVDNNGINIVNMQNGETVYGVENGEHQFVKASKVFADDPYSPPNWKVHHNDLDIYVIQEKFWITGKYVDRIKELFFGDSRFLPGFFHMPAKFLPSLSFFGLGGGLFIEYLLEKHNAVSSFFIYEPEPDFFTISCYFVDYARLFNASIHKGSTIIVGCELPNNAAKEFFILQKITAGFIRLELSVYENEPIMRAKKIFELAQNSCVRGWGTYEDEMVGYKNQLKNIDLDKPAIPILSKPQKINAPICVVGNGASLDSLLDFLRANQDNLIIFSCGTSIRTLLKNGIKPDFQIEIERLDYLADVLQESGYLPEIPIVAANVINPKTLALSQEPLIFFRDFTSGAYIKDVRTVLHFGSPFVGNAGVNLALLFSDEVLLCGVDVGYKVGSTVHSKDSIYKEDKSLPEGSIEVRPNFSDSIVYSNALFNLSKENIERAIFYMKPKSVLNLSDGAYIEGTKAAEVKELHIKPIKKSAKIKLLKKAFSMRTSDIFKSETKADVVNSMLRIKAATMEILNVEITTKQGIFTVFDRFAFTIEKFYESDLSAALLLSGSLRHIVFNAFMAFIHISSDDIGDIYRKFIPLLDEAIDSFIADFRADEAKDRVANLILKKLM